MEINQIINYFKQIADSPGKAVKQSCERNHKNAVGWVAPYAPEEIIYAANCIPVGLWGGEVELRKARTYLPAFACSIMQSVMEYETRGTYDILKAVLIPAMCDTLKCFGQKWKGACPAIPFVYPQNRRAKSAELFLENEYRSIVKKLEDILNVEITEEALRESIILYNDYRLAMREFTEIAAMHTTTISPTVRHQIIKASYFMDKKEYLCYLRELNEKLRLQPVEHSKNKRVVVSGIMLEPKGILSHFEALGIDVVGDDLAQESRQFRTDVPFAGDAIKSLARQWTNHTCSLAFDPYKQRIQHLVDLTHHFKADGVVLALMKFCDPEEYDVPIIMSKMKEENIPLLVIEVDQQATAFEQINTRLQGFVESMDI
ncbi:2-hydroxyacyl-CoA dehydratase family protein [Proteiniborus sp.]|uniref:2-hydroxyacyl-CoA dehydratase subunit D n=1 Tax=Proteiniborus sp. TaxID=2079015 RepID=UPI00331BC764